MSQSQIETVQIKAKQLNKMCWIVDSTADIKNSTLEAEAISNSAPCILSLCIGQATHPIATELLLHKNISTLSTSFVQKFSPTVKIILEQICAQSKTLPPYYQQLIERSPPADCDVSIVSLTCPEASPVCLMSLRKQLLNIAPDSILLQVDQNTLTQMDFPIEKLTDFVYYNTFTTVDLIINSCFYSHENFRIFHESMSSNPSLFIVPLSSNALSSSTFSSICNKLWFPQNIIPY